MSIICCNSRKVMQEHLSNNVFFIRVTCRDYGWWKSLFASCICHAMDPWQIANMTNTVQFDSQSRPQAIYYSCLLEIEKKLILATPNIPWYVHNSLKHTKVSVRVFLTIRSRILISIFLKLQINAKIIFLNKMDPRNNWPHFMMHEILLAPIVSDNIEFGIIRRNKYPKIFNWNLR